jgi:hypothetical protein
MRIDSAGNVGIGTSSPAKRLHIAATSGNSIINLQRTNSNTAGRVGAIGFTNDAGNYLAAVDAIGDGGNTGAFLSFRTMTGSSATEPEDVTERMRITSAGNVGIGTSSPAKPLSFATATGQKIELYNSGSNNEFGFGIESNELRVCAGDSSTITFRTGGYSGSERARITSGGNLLLGTTSSSSTSGTVIYSYTGNNQPHNNNSGAFWSAQGNMTLTNAFGTFNVAAGATKANTAPYWMAGNVGGEGAGFYINLRSGFNGGGGGDAPAYRIQYGGTDTGATISSHTWTIGQTTTGAMTLDVDSNLLVGKTASNTATAGCELRGNGLGVFTRDADDVMIVNRLTNDGIIVSIRQANTEEGTISVSGTTVSYNGGHLSRWAQTTTAKDESLVKGTVLSNLDEMNVYTDADGNPVENEQLNKVKVSDVEGDANVAGVFVNWTHDEAHDVDEINMAMTGDMIIRIAQGVTVQRGDLLMSAGDGTAKPQGDDIVRSKTIAKVTSTHVTCTYADGSYCVPCVLMAC